MRVPPAAVEAFANTAIHLIPEAQTTIEKQDQKGTTSGGGGLKSETTPINITASETLHQLHLLMLTMLAEVDWQHQQPHRYRSPLEAAREIRLYPTLLAESDQIEDQLREGRKHLDRLAQEIDLPPDPIPLGECECGEPMVAVEGQDIYECRRCGTPWEVDERKAHRQNKLDDVLANYVGTAKEISDIAKAKGFNFQRKTISKWHQRGIIEAHGEVESFGRKIATFRFGDVRRRYEESMAENRV